MEVNVLKKEDDSLLLEIRGETFTLTNTIVEFLWKNQNVLEAADFQEHPLLEEPKIWLKVERGNPVTALKKATQEALKEVEKLESEIKKAFG